MTINPAIHHVPITTPRDYTLAIIREIADAHGVPAKALFERDRRDHIVAAKRDAIAALIHAKPHLSFPDLGRIFKLDHSTVVHHAHALGITTRRGCRPTQIAAE